MKYLIIIFISILAACSGSKKIDTSEKSEIKQTNVDSVVKLKVDSTRKVYEEHMKNITSELDFYVANETELAEVINELQNALYDSTITADSLRTLFAKVKCPESKVIYRSDGSIEITGQIKSLRGTITDLQKKLDSTRFVRDAFADLKKNVTEEKKEETKHKEKKTWFPWWLLIVAYVIGWLLPPYKIYDFIKSKIKPL